MKKNKILTLLILIFSLLLTSCTGQTAQSTESISAEQKKEYIDMARGVIEKLNVGDIKEVRENSAEMLKNALTDDQMSAITGQVASNGEFEEFLEGDATLVESKGNKFGVVAQRVKYSKKTVTYTISFDEDNKLAGIYYK